MRQLANEEKWVESSNEVFGGKIWKNFWKLNVRNLEVFNEDEYEL